MSTTQAAAAGIGSEQGFTLWTKGSAKGKERDSKIWSRAGEIKVLSSTSLSLSLSLSLRDEEDEVSDSQTQKEGNNGR